MSSRDNRGRKRILRTIQLPLPTLQGKFEIPLTHEQITIVSPIDADLGHYTWCAMKDRKGFYAAHHVTDYETGKRSIELMHRVILARKLGRDLIKGEQVDHINGDKLDNRRSNLRVATHAENQRNSGIYANNTSGFLGVSAQDDKWRAQIAVNNKSIYLGLFDTPEEAHEAYCEAAEKYHGHFAKIK